MRRGVLSPGKDGRGAAPLPRGDRGSGRRRTEGVAKEAAFYLAKVVLVSALLVLALAAFLAFSHEAGKDRSLVYDSGEVTFSFVHRSFSKETAGAESAAEDEIERKEIEADGYQFYKRLNAKGGSRVSRLRYMHMGMLEILPNGSMVAFFQASESQFEGVFDQSIYWAISDDQGVTWGLPQALVSSNRKLPIWSPVAHTSGTRTFVFYSKSSKFCEYYDKAKGVMRHSPGKPAVSLTVRACVCVCVDFDSRSARPRADLLSRNCAILGGDVFFVSSNDSGETWTFPQRLFSYEEDRPAGLRGPDAEVSSSQDSEVVDDQAGSRKPFGVPKVIANKLTVLSNGVWLLPYWREPGKTCPVVRRGLDPSQWVNGSAGVLYTENQGLSWRMASEVQDTSTWLIESSIAELGDRGGLLQVYRTRAGHAYRGYSHDMGLTWTQPTRALLPNPNSKMCVLTLPNGSVLAAYNHSPTRRTPLSLSISKNGGVLWTTVAHLETDPKLQFAYPTMQISGEDLLVIYSVMSKQSGKKLESVGIKVARVSLKKLLAY